MCDNQGNSSAIQTNDVGLVRPQGSKYNHYPIDFGSFNMVFSNGYIKVPNQILYVNANMDIKQGDMFILRMSIPSNYIVCDSGVTLLAGDDETVTYYLKRVFDGKLEWLDEEDAGEWQSIDVNVTAHINPSNKSEIIIEYATQEDGVSSDIFTKKLRLLLLANQNEEIINKHKYKVLYGKTLTGYSTVYKFTPRYVITLKNGEPAADNTVE